jgi:long-chain acyl-CoA synthetase
LSQNLREIGPTFYFAPPRVFEGLLTSVMIRMEDASRIKKWLFDHYLGCGQTIWREDSRRPSGAAFKGWISYWIGDKLIYGPLRNVLGFTRIRTAYTAGEAIGPDLFSFFRSLGINLKQLYGQTEAFLYVTAQADGDVRPDTVGPAAPDVEIRIAENGEVQFKLSGHVRGLLWR